MTPHLSFSDIWLTIIPPDLHLNLPDQEYLEQFRQVLLGKQLRSTLSRNDSKVLFHLSNLLHCACTEKQSLGIDAAAAVAQLLILTPCLKALQQAKVDLLFIKGAALVLAGHYPEGVREMVDVDVVVRQSEFPRSFNLLKQRGWKLTRKMPPAFPKHLLSAEHSVDLFHPDRGALDLHFAALHECRQKGADVALWSRATKAEFQTIPIWLPHPTDLLLILCVHGSRQGGSPRWVGDAAVLLTSLEQQGGSIDWNLLHQEACSRGVSLAVYASLKFLRHQGLFCIPETTIKSLRESRLEFWEPLDFWVRSRLPIGSLLRRIFMPILDYLRCTRHADTSRPPEETRSFWGFYTFLARRWGWTK